jgi:hypothetical protein
LKTVFYQLIEEQMKTVMLANITDEYFLQTIDPAVVPEESESPKRALMLVLFSVMWAILIVFTTIAIHALRSAGAHAGQANSDTT